MVRIRYIVEEQYLEPEESLEMYRRMLSWAAPRSDRFVLGLNTRHFEDAGGLDRLLALGEVRPATPSQSRGNAVTDALSRLVSDRTVTVVGRPGPEFVRELTRVGAPPGAVSGDLSPAEDVKLLSGERALYSLADYGRTQILDLIDDELHSLRAELAGAGLPPNRLKPAPPYVTG